MSRITLLFVYHAIDLIPIFFSHFCLLLKIPEIMAQITSEKWAKNIGQQGKKGVKMTNWELYFNTLVDDCGMIKKSFLPPEAEIREQRNYTKKAIVIPTQFTAVKIQPHCEGVYL